MVKCLYPVSCILNKILTGYIYLSFYTIWSLDRCIKHVIFYIKNLIFWNLAYLDLYNLLIREKTLVKLARILFFVCIIKLYIFLFLKVVDGCMVCVVVLWYGLFLVKDGCMNIEYVWSWLCDIEYRRRILNSRECFPSPEKMELGICLKLVVWYRVQEENIKQ